MDQKIKKNIITEYAAKVSQLETALIPYTNKRITYDDINLWRLYNNDTELRDKHIRLLKYMNSTIARFVISRLIVSDHYAQRLCILSDLEKRTEFTRNSIAEVIQISLEEGWITKTVNGENKTQTLIKPTELRLKLWEAYCLHRFYMYDQYEMGKSHNLLKAILLYK